jgi:hypothetical protein
MKSQYRSRIADDLLAKKLDAFHLGKGIPYLISANQKPRTAMKSFSCPLAKTEAHKREY